MVVICEQAHSKVRAGFTLRSAETRSLPASYLLSMPVRMRELLPRLASVSLSWGDRSGERQVLVSILIQQLKKIKKGIKIFSNDKIHCYNN